MVLVRRPVYMQQSVRNSRAASMPIDFSTCMTPDSALGKINCIATHASHAADELANASRKHDVQFLHDVNRKLSLSSRPPIAAPVLRRQISVPAQQYHSKRSTWVAPSTTRHTDDYEVAAFLSGAPLRPYTPLRSASLAPAGYAGRQTISAYSTGRRPSYRWDDNDSDDVVVGVARTARHGDIHIGIPNNKRHIFESQHIVDSGPPHIPFVATRVVAPLRSEYLAQYSAPSTRITRHNSISLPVQISAPRYRAYSSDYSPGYHAEDFSNHTSAYTPAPLMAQLASYEPYEHHRSISLPVQVSAPSYHAYTSDYSPQYQAHAADFSNHASAYTPAPLMAQLASYPAYEIPYPVQHQFPVHQHHQISNAYVPPCEYHYSGAYTSPINKRTTTISSDYDDEVVTPSRVNYSSTLPRTKTSYSSSSTGLPPTSSGSGAGSGGRSLSKYGQDKGSALDKYMPKTSSVKRSDSLPYIPPVMNYKNVKAPMSDTRKKCRDLLCKSRKDPHYFD